MGSDFYEAIPNNALISSGQTIAGASQSNPARKRKMKLSLWASLFPPWLWCSADAMGAA